MWPAMGELSDELTTPSHLQNGLELIADFDMPANNRLLVLRKQSAADGNALNAAHGGSVLVHATSVMREL